MSRVSGLLLFLLLLAPAVSAAGVGKPGPKDRCPVCGMFVAPFPQWMAAAIHPDGSVRYFDGPKDLLRFRFAPEKYGAPAGDYRFFVTDYYSTRPVAAGEAFFVLSSDVLGPMGEEAVPLPTRELAETFRRDHGGDRILSWEELTPEELPR